MEIPIVVLLDQYCLARMKRDTQRQLELADIFVDSILPELISRLAERTQERNKLSIDAAVAEEESHG